MHGHGVLTALDKTVYDGAFEHGLKQGPGRFYVQGGTYKLTAQFIQNKPEFEANQILFKHVKKEEEEEVKLDPKAKGGKPDPKAKKPVEEEKEDEGKNKITYEVGKEGQFIEFDLVIVF